LVGINGAAFAATLAASDLSGFGSLTTSDGKFWLTIAGVILAVASLGMSLNASLNVGGGETIIEDMTGAEIEYAHRFELLRGYKNGRSAVERRWALIKVLNHIENPGRPHLLVTKSHSGDYLQIRVIAELTELNWQLRDVAALMESQRVILRFERAKRLIFVGIAGSVAGGLLAIWATNG
jgi:hypothetical protein